MEVSRRTFLSGSAAAALSACVHGMPPPTTGFFDSLSFLPENLEDIKAAELSGMICDVSQIEEIRDKDNVPRYLRTFAINDAAIDKAIARLAGSPLAYVALKGSDVGSRPGCAAFLQLQSCEPIGTDLSRLARFHAKGLRVLQLTHHNNNLFAGGALERVQSGLTPLGHEGLAEMNRLKILPDVSHGSEPTMREAIRASRGPVILSHGACRAIVDHPRCAPDDVIRGIADSGGAMGIFMMSFWLTQDAVPTEEHLVAQIRHVIKVGGMEAVGIANDFPMAGQTNLVKLNNNNLEGVKEYWEWWTAMKEQGIPGFNTLPTHVVIPELNRIDRMRRIAEALDHDGFTPGQIEKIMGGNWAQVLRNALG